jgi:Skp family chaperone for outer membrane proteins
VKKITLALGLAVLMTGSMTARLQAQPSAGGTKVAVVNIALVFSKYQKAQFLTSETEQVLAPYKKKGEEILAEIKKYLKPIQDGQVKDPNLKAQYEQYLVKLKRDMEDLDMQAKKLIGKKREEQIVMLFKEMTGAINAFAQANGYQLVLGYGQQIDGDLYSFGNINRLMQGMDLGSTTPLFMNVGVDISQAVVDTLNAHYRAAGGVAPSVPGIPTSSQK